MQPDIALRVTSNFAWTSLQLTLHGRKYKKQLRFCVEMEHCSKLWSEPAHACIVRSWKHKEYTSVRVQFCREYYGQKIQFKARIAGLSAITETPIVVTHGNSWRGVVCIATLRRKYYFYNYTSLCKHINCVAQFNFRDTHTKEKSPNESESEKQKAATMSDKRVSNESRCGPRRCPQ